MRYFISFITIFFIVLCSINTAFALNNPEENEPQKQYQRYEDIKKEQNKDYEKGVYKDEKKDYVKKWISEDINFQKRIIKLKSDYLAWANEMQSAGKEVIFKEYKPLKSLTAAEKEILLEYHNKFFQSKDKINANKTAESKKIKRTIPKKSNKQKIIVNKENESNEKKMAMQDLKDKELATDSVPSADSMGKGNNIFIYIILGFALILIIVECIYLIVKWNKK